MSPCLVQKSLTLQKTLRNIQNGNLMLRKFIFSLTFIGMLALIILLARGVHAAPTSTTFYVCDCGPEADAACQPGNDTNSGTTPNAPWRSYEKARMQFNTFSAGGEIRFCQGGAFDLGGAGNQWVSSGCMAGLPCVVADYTPPWASGDVPRPILWQTTSNHAFDLAEGGNANYEEGYTFQNLDMRCTACSTGGWAFFFYNDVNDVLIDNIRMDGFDIGVHLAGSNPCAAGEVQCNGRNDRITIRRATIVNSYSQGILGGGDDILIEESYFENNGDGSVFDHNIYVSGSNGMTIRNNELYRSSLDGSGNCGGTSLVGHGVLADVLIEGNWVHEDVGKANQACWGISITAAYSTAEVFSNVIMRGNRVENVGNVAIGASACLDCTIENNVIVHQQPFGVTAIAIPDLAPGAGDAVSSNMIVRNNSLALSGGTGIRLNEGSGHILVSNAIRLIGNDANWNCLDAALSADSYTAIDYNLCQFGTGEWADGVGSLAAWQALGWGAHSQVADPGFVSDVNLYPLAETAALVGAGHPSLSSPTDFDGNPRAGTPDAGAYEWIEPLVLLFLYLPLAIR